MARAKKKTKEEKAIEEKIEAEKNKVEEEKKEETNVVVKRGHSEFNLIKSNIMTCEPTHDGIVFNLKDGIQMLIVDINFTTEMKQMIKNTLTNYNPKGGTLIVDLNNYKKPVQVIIG